MPEHFTRNTLECTAWCPKCQRHTQHRVDDGRRGPCIDPLHPVQHLSKKQEKRLADEARKKQNPELF
jgi:ribosomal protein L44E